VGAMAYFPSLPRFSNKAGVKKFLLEGNISLSVIIYKQAVYTKNGHEPLNPRIYTYVGTVQHILARTFEKSERKRPKTVFF
jgi:hypothetical protein